MSKELVIAANRHEIKVAILEDDQLVEVFFQRANEYSLAGSIHKGRVTRVLPGMQSAFVDLGLERDTFLYVSDFSDETEEDFDRVPVSRESGRSERGARPPEREPALRERPVPSSAPESEPDGAPESEPDTVASAAGSTPESAAQPSSDRTDRSSERGERPDNRGGDRGRRSRRRRGRGRGFPDSKYASSEASRDTSRPPRFNDAATAAEPSSSPASSVPAAEDRPILSSAGATDFSVLPGESLAKYSRSSIQPLDEAEEDEIRELQETDAASAPETLAEIAEEAAEEPDDAPVAEETIEAIAIVSEPDAAEPEPDVIIAVSTFEEESVEQIELSPLENEDETEPTETPEDEDADAEAQAPGAQATGGEEAAREVSSQSSATPPLSAQVREQGGRSPHRMPRRMRRKMRGSGQGEPRFTGRTDAACRRRGICRGQQNPSLDQEAQRRSNVRSNVPSNAPTAVPRKAPLPSITELVEGRPRDHRSDRQRAPPEPRVRASHPTLRCLADTWCTCRRSSIPASPGKSRATRSACG